MKTKLILAAGLVAIATVSARAGVEVGINIGVPAPPPVVVAPAPVVMVPDSYAWDGYENVGYVNGTYVYLDGSVWLPLGGDRVGRFHDWERGHPDWRDHAIRNEHYREVRHDEHQDRQEHQDRHYQYSHSHRDR